jgi:hypothetical protein
MEKEDTIHEKLNRENIKNTNNMAILVTLFLRVDKLRKKLSKIVH